MRFTSDSKPRFSVDLISGKIQRKKPLLFASPPWSPFNGGSDGVKGNLPGDPQITIREAAVDARVKESGVRR